MQSSIPWIGTCQEAGRNLVNLKATNLQYYLSFSLEPELLKLLNVLNCNWYGLFLHRCKWVLVEWQSLQKWQVCEHGWDIPVLLWLWLPAHSWQTRMHRQVYCTAHGSLCFSCVVPSVLAFISFHTFLLKISKAVFSSALRLIMSCCGKREV